MNPTLMEEAILPWFFIRRVNEGGYKISQNQGVQPVQEFGG